MRLVLLAILTVPLFGQTEICRFGAGDAVDPFRRWLSASEVACGTSTELPPGRWNVFARGHGVLSSPLLVEKRVDVAALTTHPAATLTLMLPADAHGAVIYVPRRAVAYPVNATRLLVPAGEPLWLMNLERSRKVMSIVPIAPLAAGAERAVDGRIDALSASVLGWLHVSDRDAAALREATSSLSSPSVHLGSRDADPLPSLALLNGAFVLVRNVVAGDHELTVGGAGWLPQVARVSVGSRMVTTVAEPLQVRPAASLMISFSSSVDVTALDAQLGSCDPEDDRPPMFEITVSACPERKGDAPIDPKTCRAIRQETYGAEVPFGSFAVDDVAPGLYAAEMRFGKLPPVRTTASVAPLQQRAMRLSAPYLTLYGTLSRGGEPFAEDATTAFPSDGVGFSSADADGEYRAVLLDEFEVDARIDIAACDGEPRVYILADEPARGFTRYDLDIPANRMTITVTDTFTGMTLPAPTIRYDVMSKRLPKKPVVTETLRGGDMKNGRFVIEAVPEREIRMTVVHGGYQKHVVPTFTMTRREQREIDVQMMPLRGVRGRITSPIPFEEATLSWHRPSGRAGGESVDVAPDGTFAFDQQHEAGELMVLVSRSHPLWVFRMPPLAAKQTLELRFPDAPVRTFDVRVEGAEPKKANAIALAIGGIDVPSTALWHHQQFRRGTISISGNRTEKVFDILETGPIEMWIGAADAPRVRLTPGATELVLSPAVQ